MKRKFVIGGKELDCEIIRTEQWEDALIIEGRSIDNGWYSGEAERVLSILERRPEFVKFLVEALGDQT